MTKDQDNFNSEPTVEMPSGQRMAITAEITLPTNQAQLLVLAGPDRGRRFEFKNHGEIGRAHSSQVQLRDEGISGRHAAVWRNETGGFAIRDLGSRNGTKVNGETVRERTLAFGDKIALGAGTVLIFTYSDPLEDQLAQLQKMEAMGRLAAGVAHEFNNLLSVVLTNLSLLRQAPELGPAEVDACLVEALAAANRGANLTRQMLDYSQVDGAAPSPVDLSALLEELVRLLCPALDPSVSFESSVATGLTIHGDQRQVQQALMNLCLNAKDALEPGGHLALVARSERLDPRQAALPSGLLPGTHAVITIQDDGAGMGRETLERAFEPFFTTKEPGQGSGLGLSMAHGFVTKHGGAIRLASEGQGQGTCVTVYLPLMEGGEDAAEVEQSSPAAPRRERLHTGTVLVVDDDELVCKSLERTLRKLGFEVLVAGGGAEAVRLFSEHHDRVSLVLLDVIMPGMGGLEVFRALRREDPRARILIQSGYSEESVTATMLAEGALGFLKKPYEIDELRRALAAVI